MKCDQIKRLKTLTIDYIKRLLLYLWIDGEDVRDGLARTTSGRLCGRHVAEDGRVVLVADDTADLVDVVGRYLFLKGKQ